jgi:hypothetical protein
MTKSYRLKPLRSLTNQGFLPWTSRKPRKSPASGILRQLKTSEFKKHSSFIMEMRCSLTECCTMSASCPSPRWMELSSVVPFSFSYIWLHEPERLSRCCRNTLNLNRSRGFQVLANHRHITTSAAPLHPHHIQLYMTPFQRPSRQFQLGRAFISAWTGLDNPHM